MAARWGSRMKVEEGLASLCADDNDVERELTEYEREGKNFWSEVLEQAREGASGGRPQPGAWTFMSTNGKENNLCSDKKMGG